MSQENVKVGAGRTVAGIVLGALLAMVSPMLLLVLVFSLMPVVLLPSIALVALRRWAGRVPALCSAVLMLFFATFFGGGPLMLMVLFLVELPPMLLIVLQDWPFFRQLRASVALFGVGVLASVAALYLSFGGNMIERVIGQIPALVRTLPADAIAPMLQYLSGMLGRTVTAEGFYEMYESLVGELIPLYQLQVPQCLFSGALISALVCAWLSNRMRARRGLAAPGSYVPLREWALPASTTGGLLLILLASWALTLTRLNGAETVYYAVYGIANVAFAAQTLGSAARRLRMTRLGPGAQHALLIAIGLLGYMWLPDAMLVYGAASAVLGSRGAFRQRAQNRNDGNRFGGDDE